MNVLEVINQIVTLVETVNKLSEWIDMDKVPPFLIGINLHYSPQKKIEHKNQDEDENRQKKEPS